MATNTESRRVYMRAYQKKRRAKVEACYRAFVYARDHQFPELAGLFNKLPRELQERLDEAFEGD